MKSFMMSAAVVACMLISSCSKETRCISGKGDRVSRDYRVSEFSRLHISGSEHVEISHGETHSLRIEAQENIHHRVKAGVSGGELEIELQKCVMSHQTVKVFITTPELESISLSGSGDVEVKDNFAAEDVRLHISGSGSIRHRLTADHLSVEIAGSGEVFTRGEADVQEVKITGSGDYKAFPLQSRICKFWITGAGDSEVSVSERLEAQITGSGDIRYRGNPTISVSGIGSGEVHQD